MPSTAKPLPDLTPGQIERFHNQYERKGRCWLWTGERRNEYGTFKANGSKYPAHRIAFWLARGEKPDPALSICHKCDNPLCVRPRHLLERTHYWNVKDRDRKGRTARGTDYPHAVLTEETASAAKRALAAGKAPAELAERYGVTKSAIRDLGLGLSWTHIRPKGAVIQFVYAKIDWRLAERIRKAHQDGPGKRHVDLAAEFGVSTSSVSDVLKGARASHSIQLPSRVRAKMRKLVERSGVAEVSRLTGLSRHAVHDATRPE